MPRKINRTYTPQCIWDSINEGIYFIKAAIAKLDNDIGQYI